MTMLRMLLTMMLDLIRLHPILRCGDVRPNLGLLCPLGFTDSSIKGSRNLSNFLEQVGQSPSVDLMP